MGVYSIYRLLHGQLAVRYIYCRIFNIYTGSWPVTNVVKYKSMTMMGMSLRNCLL